MKFSTDRPYADPEKAACKLLEIANTIHPVERKDLNREDKRADVIEEGASPQNPVRPTLCDRHGLALAA
ncbi:hypothetical protein [Bradyrhizobium sp. JYMT SZCCT0428]|uniref:hypothetical protein n=1 Tax=Bradyrhizobium sp. JYMT SZCCT0428 TaxID=2807673 RepID=UPI0020129AC1|nr:hypothetical protein [Bradyrhizobium sp. JYMT SZCCT0428]